MESNEIIYTLAATGDRSTLLQQASNDLKAKLTAKFGHEYTVSADSFTAPEKDWSQEIKVRKGNKIGAGANLHWSQSSPNILKIEVEESTKMGTAITLGIIVPFILVGAYMGYNHIAPFDFLPGKKIAAAITGLITMVPGVILALIIKSILLKKQKSENEQLVIEVRQAIQA